MDREVKVREFFSIGKSKSFLLNKICGDVIPRSSYKMDYRGLADALPLSSC